MPLVAGVVWSQSRFHPGSFFTTCVTLRSVFNLAKLWFSHLQIGDNNNPDTLYRFFFPS